RAPAGAPPGRAARRLPAAGGNAPAGTPAAARGDHNATASASASAPASQGQHNAADAAFAKGMIPHHRQAVEMADLAPGRAQSAEVKKLAADIKKAQDPEIKTLSGWLTSWGEEVSAEGAMAHSMHGMAGMMTAEEMTELEHASGKAYDTPFMEMMIKHPEGAVEMPKTE